MAGISPLKAEDVKFIAVHCSATPPTNNASAKDIDRWHRAQGFLKIGYHLVIRRDGTLETGRVLTQRGAHVEDFNHSSIGVCMVGGVDSQMKPAANFTEPQFDTLKTVLADLLLKFPGAEIKGHREFPNVAKACPSFSVKDWLKTGRVLP